MRRPDNACAARAASETTTPHGSPERPAGAHSAHYARIAALLGELSDEFAALAAEPEVQLAVSAPQSDITTAVDPFLPVEAVAELLAVSPATVRRWRREDHLPPPLSVAGVIRWRRSVIEAWLADQEGNAR